MQSLNSWKFKLHTTLLKINDKSNGISKITDRKSVHLFV